MAAPPISERHLHHFHRRSPIKESVRAATTANITIATALNNGDTLDGVTLATDDRVLVKDQSTGSQNGIYVVGVTPVRAYDQSTDDPAFGFLVYVREGTANAATTWANTNTSAPTIDTTALTFAASGGGSGAPTGADYLVGTANGGLSAEIVVGTTPGGELGGTWASPTVDSTHSGSAHTDFIAKAIVDAKGDIIAGTAADTVSRLAVGADGTFLKADSAQTTGLAWASASGSGTVTTVKDEGSTLSSAVVSIDFVGAGVTATGTTAVTVTIPGGGGGSDLVQVASGAGSVIIPGLAGSPDIQVAGGNDDEFDTTDTSDPMTGWTTLGTPTTHDINSTAKSHYYVKQTATGGTAWVGIYKNNPATPFTMTAKLAGNIYRANYMTAGIAVIEAGPGKLATLHRGYNSTEGSIGWELFTNRTTYSTTYTQMQNRVNGPCWLRLVVTSSSNIAAYFSYDGLAWILIESGRNPGFTVASVGLIAKAENGTYDTAAFFDWVRFT